MAVGKLAEATNATVCFLQYDRIDKKINMTDDDQLRFRKFFWGCLQFLSTVFLISGSQASLWFLFIVMVLQVSIDEGFEVGVGELYTSCNCKNPEPQNRIFQKEIFPLEIDNRCPRAMSSFFRDEGVPVHGVTTVMICDIPCRQSIDQILEAIEMYNISIISYFLKLNYILLI